MDSGMENTDGLSASADQPTSSITTSDAIERGEGTVAPEDVRLEPAIPSSPATDDLPRTSAQTPEPEIGKALSASSTNESETTQMPTVTTSDIVNAFIEQQFESRIDAIVGGLYCIADPAPTPSPTIIPPTPPPPPPLPVVRVHSSTPAYHSFRPRPVLQLRRYTPVESPDTTRCYTPVDSLPACIVCLDERPRCQNRPCCAQPVCSECMLQMTHVSINDGIAHIECPNPNCSKALTKDEVIQLIGADRELRNKYDRFVVDAGGDNNKKTCPRCCLITEHRLPRKFRLKEEDLKLRCTSCDLEWCFKCHAPWHTGLACKTFKKGDKQFQDWTKGKRLEGDANCRQCPTCRVYIQRNQGCDHMTCSRCESEFCYKCGGVYPWVPIPGIGDHHTQLSIFGCEYNYTGSTSERRALRGSYLAAKIASLTGYPFLFAGGVALLLGAGIVVVPIYVGYRFYRYHKNTSKYRVKRRR